MIQHPSFQLSEQIVDLGIAVHNATGPGLDAAAYTECLCIELADAGLSFERNVPNWLVYDGKCLGDPFYADIVAERSVVISVKAVDEVTYEHEKEIRTWMLTSGCEVGLVLNFNTLKPMDGFRRFIAGQFADGQFSA